MVVFPLFVISLYYSVLDGGRRVENREPKIKHSSDMIAKMNSPDLCCGYIRLGKFFHVPGPKLLYLVFWSYSGQQGFNIHVEEALEGCEEHGLQSPCLYLGGHPKEYSCISLLVST